MEDWRERADRLRTEADRTHALHSQAAAQARSNADAIRNAHIDAERQRAQDAVVNNMRIQAEREIAARTADFRAQYPNVDRFNTNAIRTGNANVERYVRETKAYYDYNQNVQRQSWWQRLWHR